MSTFPLPTTLPVCGPGSYDIIPKYSVRPNYVGFSSTTYDRGIIRDDDANVTPGPGHYCHDCVSFVSSRGGLCPPSRSCSCPCCCNLSSSSRHMTAVFKSRAPRMAPTITGSSLFSASSIVDNPGPGSYHNEDNDRQIWSPRGYRLRPRQCRSISGEECTRRNNAKRNDVKAVAAMVPLLVTCTDSDGKKNQMGFSFSLARSNRLPFTNAVNESASSRKFGRMRQRPMSTPSASFSAMDRTDSWIAKSITPGPQAYDPNKLDGHKAGMSVPFRSRVKMAHQTMDPVDYRGTITKEPKATQSTQTAQKMRKEKVTVQSFGALSKRDTNPIMNEHLSKNLPFPSRAQIEASQAVGPGSYDTIDAFPNIANANTHSIHGLGFNTSAKRPCLNHTASNTPTPGPACHYPERYDASLRHRLYSIGRNGVFGTTSLRFPQKSKPSPMPTQQIHPHDNHSQSNLPFNPIPLKKPKFHTRLFNNINVETTPISLPSSTLFGLDKNHHEHQLHQTPPSSPTQTSLTKTTTKTKTTPSPPKKKQQSNFFGSKRDITRNIDGTKINDSPGVGSYDTSHHHDMVKRGRLVVPRVRKMMGTFGTDDRRGVVGKEDDGIKESNGDWETSWVPVEE